jgi:predicted TIM-barrel fold metal-dependent hydrolase
MKNKFFALIASICLLSSAVAQDTKAVDHSNMLIADVHRHVQHWISPSSLLAEMDELKIGWAGAVSAPYGPWDIQPYIQLLGKRYIATTGQMTLTDIHRFKGVRAMEDAQTQDYKALQDEANQFFGAGAIKGLGELILNNENTNPNPSVRRKAKIDSPGITQLLDIAKRWNGFVQIHAEDDVNSVKELSNIATQYSTVPIILSHCLFTPNSALIDELLSKHPNFYCEMSARNESMYGNYFAKQRAEKFGWIVFDDQNLKSDWKALIEKHPTRFMVGTDNYNPSVDTRKVVRQIRQGLLRNLPLDVAKQVASENAIRVMRLE